MDIGGGTREDVEEDEADLEITECSLFPLTEHRDSPMLRQSFSKPAHAPNMEGFKFGEQHADRLAFQTGRIRLL